MAPAALSFLRASARTWAGQHLGPLAVSCARAGCKFPPRPSWPTTRQQRQEQRRAGPVWRHRLPSCVVSMTSALPSLRDHGSSLLRLTAQRRHQILNQDWLPTSYIILQPAPSTAKEYSVVKYSVVDLLMSMNWKLPLVFSQFHSRSEKIENWVDTDNNIT